MCVRMGFALAVVATVAVGSAGAQTELPFYINVLANESFEADGAAHDSLGTATPPEWLVTGNTTQVDYGASGLFPTNPQEGGLHFLAGGPQSPVSSVSQEFVVTGWGSRHDIDIGWTTFEFGALLGGASTEADQSVAEVQFADSTGASLGSVVLGPITAADRNNQTSLLPRLASGTVPIGTRRVSCTVTMTRVDGSYNNAYCDGLWLRFIDPDALAPRTWSEIKDLYRAER